MILNVFDVKLGLSCHRYDRQRQHGRQQEWGPHGHTSKGSELSNEDSFGNVSCCRNYLGLPKSDAIHLGDFIVPHPPVVVRQEGSSLACHDGSLSIGPGKGIYRLIGLPDGRDQNLDGVSIGPDKDARGDVPIEFAE
jgi:hypothetical protein